MKFFEEVDFSDVREELAHDKSKPSKPKRSITIPNKQNFNTLFNEINGEFIKLEAGTSSFRKVAVTFKSQSPASAVLERVFKKNNWSESSLEELVTLTKQDYGFSAAKWVAEKLSPYHPNLPTMLLHQQGG